MKISTMMYLFLDAMKSLKRNMTLTIVSIITISFTLSILGVFMIYILSIGMNFEKIASGNRTIIIFVKYVKLILFIILPPISLLMVTNEAKMVVYTRKNEISIMKFVGATNCFVRWPFIFQGVFIGLIGALVGNLSLYCIYNLIYSKIMKWELGLILVEPIYVIKKMLFLFLVIGILLAVIGNIIALKKVLKEEIYEK